MNLVSIPANPVPEDVVTGMLKTSDGVSLRFARWAPPPGRKGTVCLFPGRAEFIEKYFETVRDLRARGFAVAALDWRGQGGSQRQLRNPRKGYVRRFADYDVDLATFMHEVVLPDCPPPVFGLAHSMGATVLIRAAQQGHRWFDRMVLLAPLIGLPGLRRSIATRVAVRAMRMIGLGGAYVPGGDASVMQQRPFIGNLLTSDPVRYARNVAVLEFGAFAGDRLADGGVGRFRVQDDQDPGRARLSHQDPPADAGDRRGPRPDRIDGSDR